MDFGTQLKHIERILDIGEYTIAAKECVGLIEQALRQLFRDQLTQLDEKDRLKVQETERTIGGGNIGVERFTMGRLVRLFLQSHFLDAWERVSGKALNNVRIINLDELTRLRNKFIHDGIEATRSEAEFLLKCLHVILEAFSFLGDETSSEIPSRNDRTKHKQERRIPEPSKPPISEQANTITLSQELKTSPYNCAIPGRLFVGYERLRRRLLAGFLNGNSYAILGGRRCGKTSFLLQIERDLHAQTNALRPFYPLPRYLDIQGIDSVTPAVLFETLYGLIVQECEAPRWDDAGETGREYQTFMQHLDMAKPVLQARYGCDWLVIVLIDEMDAALAKLSDDQFFQNLRNLLMVSRFRRHFRLVATGVREMSKLILSGSSPLNNLRRQHLRILRGDEIDTLIQAGFRKGLNRSSEYLLLELTGGHPYLLQGLLEDIWYERDHIDETLVKQAAKEFLHQHSDFEYWVEYFGPPEHAVYQQLAEAQDSKLHIRDLREGMEPSIVGNLDEAITILSYHGVIDTSDPDNPCLAGTLFRDWYRANQAFLASQPEC